MRIGINYLIKLKEVGLNLLRHSREIGLMGSAEAIPFMTTLAALIYILSLTLGSGGYKDVLPNTGLFVEATMIAAALVFAILFSICLASYLDNIIDFIPPSDSRKKREAIFGGATVKFLVWGSIFTSVAIGTYRVYSSKGFFPNIYEDEDWAFYFVLFFAGALAIFFVVERYFIEVPFSIFIVTAFIYICVMGVTLGVYRDSHKSATISDSQYCYWIRSGISSGAAPNPDKNTCQSIAERGILFQTILLENSER